ADDSAEVSARIFLEGTESVRRSEAGFHPGRDVDGDATRYVHRHERVEVEISFNGDVMRLLWRDRGCSRSLDDGKQAEAGRECSAHRQARPCPVASLHGYSPSLLHMDATSLASLRTAPGTVLPCVQASRPIYYAVQKSGAKRSASHRIGRRRRETVKITGSCNQLSSGFEKRMFSPSCQTGRGALA